MASEPSAADAAITASGLDGLLKEIIATTQVFAVPENFDPRTADAARLAELGLPPKPDRATQPELYALWWKMFSPPLRFVDAEFSFPVDLQHDAFGPLLTGLGRGFPHDSFGSTQPLGTPGTRYESSLNWSGGYITPKNGRMVTELYGMWQVPTPSPPAGAPANADYHSSTWIGLDGQRRYLNSSLPQIGTAQFVTLVNGQATQTINAWWQWWARGRRLPPVGLSLAVKPGDLIICSLIVINRTTVRFYIKNQTTGNFVRPFDRPAPSVGRAAARVQLKVSGATAEWIMERPRDLRPPYPLYELPDYGTVLFSNCLAVAAHDPGSAGVSQTLPGAVLVSMFAVRQNPQRTAKISVAERVGDQEVATFYR
jgi:hypothetical protein